MGVAAEKRYVCSIILKHKKILLISKRFQTDVEEVMELPREAQGEKWHKVRATEVLGEKGEGLCCLWHSQTIFPSHIHS